jgi:hypothetical protein
MSYAARRIFFGFCIGQSKELILAADVVSQVSSR